MTRSPFNTKTNNSLGIILMLWAGFFFAVMASATKWASPGLPAAQVVFIRSALSSAALLIFFLVRKNRDWTGKQPMVLLARGVIGFMALILYFWALPQIHLGTAVILNYTAPIFAVVASHLLLKDKSSLAQKILIGASFLGVYLLSAPQMSHKTIPLLAALMSGFLAGMVHLLIRQSHDEDESPLLIIYYFTMTCTAGSGLMLPFSGWIAPEPWQWGGLLILTVSSFLGQLGLTYSLRNGSVSAVSPFGYIAPVIALILGWLLWNEAPSLSGLAGSAIVILCGTWLYKQQS